MLDKPYRRVRQPLKTDIFMMFRMLMESIRNEPFIKDQLFLVWA